VKERFESLNTLANSHSIGAGYKYNK